MLRPMALAVLKLIAKWNSAVSDDEKNNDE
jgi:hypothetical protein